MPEGPHSLQRNASLPRTLMRMLLITAGSVAIPDAIVATRGVTVLRFIEAPPSGRGSERISSRRLCGAALAQAAPYLSSQRSSNRVLL